MREQLLGVSMPVYGRKSKELLAKAHEELQEIFEEVIKSIDCTIICSTRSAADQQKAFDAGLSKAKPGQSPHNFEPSLAVDAVPTVILKGKSVDHDGNEVILDWNSKDPKIQALVREEMVHFAGIVKGKAAVLGLKIKWGGDFKSFKDMPHWELLDWETRKKT